MNKIVFILLAIEYIFYVEYPMLYVQYLIIYV